MLVMILCNTFQWSFAQKNYVEADGIIEYHNRIPLAGATLVLYDGNREVNRLKTKQDGRYNFILEYNKEYILEISKKDLVTKKVKYVTTMPPKLKGGWWVGIPINLYEICPGMDASVFKDPVAVIRYDRRRKEYEADPDYDKRMRNRIKSFENKNDDCLEDKFIKLIKNAEELAEKSHLEESRALFKEASEKRPWEPYPKEKLKELNTALAKQDAKKSMYDKNINVADKLFEGGNLVAAKSYYKRASTILPSHPYAGKKIREIDNQLDEQTNQYQATPKKVHEKDEEKDKAFVEALAKGNNHLSLGNYEQAKQSFITAQQLKPEHALPKQKIKKIDDLQKQKKLQAAREKKNIKYNKAISDGDGYLAIQEYSLAKQAYNLAHTIKPDETYPTLKITEIDKKVAQENALKQEKRVQERKFNQFIKLADNYYTAGELSKARQAFMKASDVKPGESYPKKKIANIDELLNAQRLAKQREQQNEKDYQQAVEQGDMLMGQGDIESARLQYLKALRLKQKDAYVASKLKEISAKLEAENKRKQEKENRKQQYNDLIASADDQLNSARYEKAKSTYQQALKIDPEADYPRKRIVQINDILTKLAASDKIIEKESKKINETSLPELVFKDEEELGRYLVELKRKYPEGITLEVYEEEKKTIRRFIIVRNDEATEFREIRHYWGGRDYSKNDKPITQQYFVQQTKRRTNEYYNMVEM